MKVLTFANHKGGVGKTTSTLTVGQELARRGQRVLFLDCDPQHNLTMSFPERAAAHLGTVIRGERTLREIIIGVGEGQGLASSARELTQLEKVLGQQPAYQFFLRDQLDHHAFEGGGCRFDAHAGSVGFANVVLQDLGIPWFVAR